MYYNHRHPYLSAGAPLPADVPGQQIFDRQVGAAVPADAEDASARRIAVPAAGAIPSFDNVYALALASALFEHTVAVICMTEEVLTDWRQRLQARAKPVEGLTLLDGRCGWSADWRAFFCTRSYDITVLHGIHRALEEHNLPRSYAERLARAVPRGLIVLA